MNPSDAIVFVVDDDSSVCTSLKRLLKSAGWDVATFASAREFLDYNHPEKPSCVILDIRLPDLSGLDLQDQMAAAGLSMPIIFITGHGTVPMSVRAMKAGAVDFLEKPFDQKILFDAVKKAVEKDTKAREDRAIKSEVKSLYETLSPREREVFSWVITGMLNKQIAAELGIAEKTVKVHRAQVMRKMQVVSVAEMVRLAELLGITPPAKF